MIENISDDPLILMILYSGLKKNLKAQSREEDFGSILIEPDIQITQANNSLPSYADGGGIPSLIHIASSPWGKFCVMISSWRDQNKSIRDFMPGSSLFTGTRCLLLEAKFFKQAGTRAFFVNFYLIGKLFISVGFIVTKHTELRKEL